jgi:hypothetical protein
LNPALLFHLGDVVYGPGKESHYGERFYTPYRRYPGKIVAIPGNHDGEVKSKEDAPSLSAFRAYFCADVATIPSQASGSGIFRENMTQPGVYWLLDAPFVRIIGLYSNLLENPGFLQGKTENGDDDSSQLDWLKKTLTKIARNATKKALIIATHYPPYSQSGHSGSTEMSQSIDEICNSTGVFPDAFSVTRTTISATPGELAVSKSRIMCSGPAEFRPRKLPPRSDSPRMKAIRQLMMPPCRRSGICSSRFRRPSSRPSSYQPFDPLTVDLKTHLLKDLKTHLLK